MAFAGLTGFLSPEHIPDMTGRSHVDTLSPGNGEEGGTCFPFSPVENWVL